MLCLRGPAFRQSSQTTHEQRSRSVFIVSLRCAQRALVRVDGTKSRDEQDDGYVGSESGYDLYNSEHVTSRGKCADGHIIRPPPPGVNLPYSGRGPQWLRPRYTEPGTSNPLDSVSMPL